MFLAGCPVTTRQDVPGQVLELREPTTSEPYWAYIPSTYTDDRWWPMVVTLHGTEPFDGFTRQRDEWKALAEERGFIVIAPRLASSQGILPHIRSTWYENLAHDEQVILGCMDDISSKYRVDPHRVLLTGFSSGGLPMYYTGLRNPKRFDMLVARACNSDMEMMDKIDLTKAAKKLPVLIFWGKSDLEVIQKQSWDSFNYLRTHGFDGVEQKEVLGGHLRRPEMAYDAWRPRLPSEYVAHNHW